MTAPDDIDVNEYTTLRSPDHPEVAKAPALVSRGRVD
jgi:hypothetical protein